MQKSDEYQKIAELQRLVNDIVESDSVGEAKKLAAAIDGALLRDPDFKKNNGILFDFLSEMLTNLKFVFLFDLPEKEVVSLIKNNFDFVIRYSGYDLQRKFYYKIRTVLDLTERDVLKETVRKNLLEDRTLVSSKKIIISESEQLPTVANWIKDYIAKYGLEPVNKLKFNEYIFSDSNAKSLTEEERRNLKKVLLFFESIKKSSQEEPILDESFVAILPNNEIAVFSDGDFKRIGREIINQLPEIDTNALSEDNEKEISPVNKLEEILDNYSADSLEYKAIQQEIKNIQSQKNINQNAKQ